MSNFDKYLLLASLSFFFASMAIALIGLNFSQSPASASYMYFPGMDAAGEAPLDQATRQYNMSLPKSVLHYPLETALQRDTVNCYLEAEYKKLLEERTEKLGAMLAAEGIINEDRMEIYITDDKRFFVFITGLDAIGQAESCEVASGVNWKLAVP